ncbi:hypothetical protein DdX_07048 [Ditylenchus destructor]|uniref:Uncharacterized protein n=1 Tax=Ditylenchus destructor TaxID=166010 RepID=A0AAD4N460_9BILA|nr:hypothetical protein DdX_07048 [Ditylenchus destructor]
MSHKLLQILCFFALLSMILATAFDYNRLRQEKKAMRNSLVRFGKRNFYRPAGEAFVSAFDEFGGRSLAEPSDAPQRAYALPILRFQRRQDESYDNPPTKY